MALQGRRTLNQTGMERMTVNSKAIPRACVCLAHLTTEVGSSAGIWSNLSGADSFGSGLPGPVPPLNYKTLSLREPLITNWLTSTLSSLAPDAPTIVPATIKNPEREEAAGPLGDWLV